MRPCLPPLPVLSSHPGTEEVLETCFWNEIKWAMSIVCFSSRSSQFVIFHWDVHSCVFFSSLPNHFD